MVIMRVVAPKYARYEERRARKSTMWRFRYGLCKGICLKKIYHIFITFCPPYILYLAKCGCHFLELCQWDVSVSVSVKYLEGLAKVLPWFDFTFCSYTAKTKYRNFEKNIPRKGISGPQSQFPHSCVCEPFIYFHDRCAYSAGGNI